MAAAAAEPFDDPDQYDDPTIELQQGFTRDTLREALQDADFYNNFGPLFDESDVNPQLQKLLEELKRSAAVVPPAPLPPVGHGSGTLGGMPGKPK